MSTETYDPRKRTFIKVPEIKLCPTCGHQMIADVKPMTNIMNRYINPLSGRVVAINSGDDTVEQSGVILYRCELERNEKREYYSLLVPKTPVALVESPKVPVVATNMAHGHHIMTPQVPVVVPAAPVTISLTPKANP